MANVPALLTPNIGQVLLALSMTLDFNHRSVINNLTSSLPLMKEEESNNEIEVHDDREMDAETETDASVRRRKADLPTLIEIEIKHVGWLLLAQRIAAEVFSNLCSSEDEEWKDEMDDGNVSEEESVQDYDMSSDTVPNNDKLPVELLEAFKALGIIEKVKYYRNDKSLIDY
jgi:HEAT repeat-containing protein 3